ncbi:MAG: hypothetical protein WC815_06640 [Vicinamibacterales bacterium]
MWFALLIPLLAALAETTDRQTRTVPLPEGRAIAIEATVGSVRIDGWDKPEAEITIERRVPTPAHQARLPIEIDDGPSRLVIRAVQADGGTDPSLRVDIVLRVPRAALIDMVRVMEGRIAINSFRGSLTADLRRGPIDATDVSGTLRLDTGIGPITITAARLLPGGLLRARAFNGAVRLRLSERPADARIMALALNGTITSAIPLTMKDTWGPRWGEATLGKGEPVISLDVVTGTIDIRSP